MDQGCGPCRHPPAAHPSKVLHENAHEIFGHQEAQELLRDQLPVTNTRSICQALVEHGRTTQDPRLEQILQDALKGGAETAGIEPTLAERLQTQLSETTNRQEAAGQPAVLLVAPTLRPWLARFLRFAVPTLRVLAYNEVPDSKRVRLIAAVGT